MHETPKTALTAPLLDQLCADFSELNRHHLPDTVTTLNDLAGPLAQAHDLTPSEASEALQDWALTQHAAQNLRLAA